jgi:hypothetical protein
MAQTISIQRGTVSLTPSGSSPVTLWTQSGGTATRVIFGSISGWFTQSITTSGSTTFALAFTPSGASYEIMVGYMAVKPSTTTYGFAILPGQGAPSAQISTTSSAYSTLPSATVLTSVNSGATLFANMNPSYLRILMPGNRYSDYQSQFQSFPDNFWIGPGDVVQINCSNYSSGGTLYLTYEFVLVTES